MINVVKLIIVNLLGLFDLNKILIARDSGVKSNNEKKLIKVIDIVDGKLLAKVDNELVLINSGEITFHWFKVKFNKK